MKKRKMIRRKVVNQLFWHRKKQKQQSNSTGPEKDDSPIDLLFKIMFQISQ
jgi:hypothetical protein